MLTNFREKSLWVTLAALVVVFSGYFLSLLEIFPALASYDVRPPHAVLFFIATLLLVLILVVGHGVIALMDRRTEPDERDRSIENTGVRYGSFVLAVGVFASLCTALVSRGNAIMAYVLLGSWIVAQCTEIACQLVLYRRGR